MSNNQILNIVHTLRGTNSLSGIYETPNNFWCYAVNSIIFVEPTYNTPANRLNILLRDCLLWCSLSHPCVFSTFAATIRGIWRQKFLSLIYSWGDWGHKAFSIILALFIVWPYQNKQPRLDLKGGGPATTEYHLGQAWVKALGTLIFPHTWTTQRLDSTQLNRLGI